jgi:hypothetical protein
MKNKTIYIYLSIIALAITFHAKSQSFTLPRGYQTYKDYDGNEQRVDDDFDGDGMNDLAIVCSSKNDEKIVVVYLASNYLNDQSYWWFPWTYMMSSIEYKNNILIVGSSDCAGRCYKTLRLKYYANLNNMKLIGYEEGNYGDASHDGAYNKTININTGEYEINGVKNKISFELITLTNIEKFFDYLSYLGTDD